MSAAPVACVVVAFHRPAALDRLLAGLARPDLELVVANVGTDGEIERVARRHGATTIAVPGNPGYAAAVNAGAARVRAEVVVFLNDDLVVDADTIARLAAVVASGRADVAVPAIVDGRGDVERTIAAVPSVRALALEWMALPDRPVPGLRRLPIQKWRRPEQPEFVDAATGAVVAVRAAVLRRHPLPEAYFLYWEESEWFWHLRRAGLVVQYRPELRVGHDGGRDDVRPDKARLLARNAVRCIRRTGGPAAAAVALPVVVAWHIRLLVVDGLRAALRRDERSRRVLSARRAGLAAAVGSWRELRGGRS